MGDPPVSAVYQEIVAPACEGVAVKVTEPASQRVDVEELVFVEVIVGTAVITVATTLVLADLQAPISVEAPA